jgi:glycosyltransferase involved in cell wall biosynthesis
LPKIHFKIIGKAQGEDSKNEVNKLKMLKNVEYLEWLPNNLVPREISNAKALINVSKYEGFSNVFLEAWASGIPVISLFVNPGNIIIENNLGYFADGNIEVMKNMIKNYKNDLSKNNLKDYVLKNHSFDNAAKKFVDIINKARNQ